MKKLLLLIIISIFNNLMAYSQNLLKEDVDGWTEGREMIQGFINMGDYEENIRVYGKNPAGENKLLWKSTPLLGDDNNGGFYTSFHPIDHKLEYRLSVWFKKNGYYFRSIFYGTICKGGYAYDS